MNNLFVWQKCVWQQLMRNDALRCHALLLKGRKGIGKFTFARFLAKSLLCRQPDDENAACGQCASCNWFEKQMHPNFVMVLPQALSAAMNNNTAGVDDSAEEEAARQSAESKGNKKAKKPSRQIGIDQIRKLNDLVYMSGHQQGYKIVLIYPAENMNVAAANALLKKLEEPPEKTLLILVSHQPQRLLPTVRSRCQQVNMPAPDIETAVEWIMQQQQAQAEPKGRQDALMLLAANSYSPLSALSFQENAQQYRQFVEAISIYQRFDPLALAETLQNQDLAVTVDWLQKWCYDLASYHATGKVRYHPHLTAQIQTLCQQTNAQACIAFVRFLNIRQPLSRHPVNGRLFLEELFIQYERLITASSCALDFV